MDVQMAVWAGHRSLPSRSESATDRLSCLSWPPGAHLPRPAQPLPPATVHLPSGPSSPVTPSPSLPGPPKSTKSFSGPSNHSPQPPTPPVLVMNATAPPVH